MRDVLVCLHSPPLTFIGRCQEFSAANWSWSLPEPTFYTNEEPARGRSKAVAATPGRPTGLVGRAWLSTNQPYFRLVDWFVGPYAHDALLASS